MARIFGPANGHASLKGTTGSDFITAYGDDNTVTGGGGSDTIQANSGNGNVLRLGTAQDGLTGLGGLIRANGDGDTISAGDERVRVAGSYSFSTLAFGAGNSIALGGGSDTVKAAGGNNIFFFDWESSTTYTDSVIFSGAHNSLDNTLSHGVYPEIGVLDVTGGSGHGTFLLGATAGTIVTHGVGNFIEGGAYGTKIEAGGGYDTVSLIGGARGVGGSATVLLGGTHNLVDGSVATVSVSGGMGHDTLDFSHPTGTASIQVNDGGTHDSIALDAAHATITGGGSYETVSAISSVATMTFTGHSDLLYVSGSENAAGMPSATVDDLSAGLRIELGARDDSSGDTFAATGNLTIDGFDSTGVIEFLDGRGGFTSKAEIVSDLHAYAPGDYTLALPDGTGTITFLNASHLGAANFKFG